MPYLGNNLGVAFSSYKLIDSLTASFNGTTTSFALTVNGVTPVPFPLNEQNILLSVGGVPQKPDSTGTEGFRFSGSNIVFSSAPKTGEAFWGVILAGADRVNAGVQYPDGTASVPSISFASQTTTGFYRSGSGQIGVGINGSTPVAFSTAGLQLNGSTSGYTILSAPAAAGSNTLTLPANNGSSGQVLSTNGSGALSWASTGKFGQVVQSTITTEFVFSSATYADATNFNASITPTSSSSRVLVIMTPHVFIDNYSAGSTIITGKIVRGSTDVFELALAGGYAQNTGHPYPMIYLDSPATTSATTYKLQVKASSTYNNSRINTSFQTAAKSTITLIEVLP